MSQQLFVDREGELQFLTDRYRSPVPECLILYGRRRVGKTTLLARFLQTVPGFYYLASEEGTARNLQDFSHYAGEFLDDPDFERSRYPDWEAVIKALVRHRNFSPPPGKKVVIVIDEFPYLIARDRATPSIFQRVWDTVLSREPVMLVISGSSVSTMETEVLGYTSPLYGRRTGQWQLEPLSYPYLRRFLPYDEEELVMTWCVIGGIPAYLRLFHPDRTFWENVEEQILRKGAYLYSEAEILMQYEFREAGNYMAILRALAAGYTALGPLCQETGLDKGMVSKYLAVLSRMHLINDEVPVTAHAGYRRRHYRLTDPYLAFWFRFVYPRRAETEMGQSGEVLASIREEIAPYCGQMFEKLSHDLVCLGTLFGSSYSRLGRWWQKEMEIDLVGLNEVSGDALFCECKWSAVNRRQARGILAALQEKASMVRWRNESRNERFALVAKSIDGKEDLREDGYLVADLEDIARLS
ncbi:MAG: ATP-binding protein, partial [Methanomicrobiales archaeon]|nr:ATP-binding protein [Methanomicrobiales archaeon]